MPEDLQGKQTEAAETLLCLSLYNEDVEEEVIRLINKNNRNNTEGFPALAFLAQLEQDSKK